MFYERLKILCDEKGITITNLVAELNMSSGNLSKWKRGKTPKSDTVKVLANYFDVSSDYLLGVDSLKEKSLVLLDDPEVTLTSDEKWFILKLRQLDKEGRIVVEGALVQEVRRVENKKETTVGIG